MNSINLINNSFVPAEPKQAERVGMPVSAVPAAAGNADTQPVLPITQNIEQAGQDNPYQNEKFNKAMESLQIEYGIKVEIGPDDNGKIYVRIMSSDGERVLRQMPPDSIIKMHADLKNNHGGILTDWLV